VVRNFLIWIIKTLIVLVNSLNYCINKKDKKLWDSIPVSDWLVHTEGGYVKLNEVHLTRPYKIHTIRTKDYSLSCADNHLVYNGNKLFNVSDLVVGSDVSTFNGIQNIVDIEKSLFYSNMFDISVESTSYKPHSYYSSGILSHNTVTSAIYFAWYSIFNSDKVLMLLANKERTAKELISKTSTVLENLPFFLKPGIIEKNKKQLILDTNSKITSETTTENSARGDTVHVLYMDEFAFVPDNIARNFYTSAYATMSSSEIAQIIITSTPNGKNTFYDIYSNAINGKNVFKPIRVDWWQDDKKDDNWFWDTLANFNYDYDRFNQEYGNQFVSGNKVLLETKTLKRMQKMKSSYVFKQIDALDDLGTQTTAFDYSDLVWHPKFNIEELTNPDSYFVFSVDLSSSLNQDYNVVNIFKVIPFTKSKINSILNFSGEQDFFGLLQVGMLRSNTISFDDLTSIVYILSTKLINDDNVKIVVEMNHRGDEFIYRLDTIFGDWNDFGLHKIANFKHTKDAKREKPGIKVTSTNKALICKKGKESIDNNRILVTETMSFEEISNFGKNESGTKFESSVGTMDIAMTVMNVANIFETSDWQVLTGELFEKMDSEFVNLVNEKMGDTSEYQSNEDLFNINLTTNNRIN
jgi:hypothetical protein